MRMKLDATVVATVSCPPGKRRLDVYCTHNRGLVLEVRPSGGRTYYVRATGPDGKLRNPKIGRADQISFEQARKKARQLVAEIALGGDPNAEKKVQRSVITYNDLADRHVAHARTYMKSIKTLEGYLRRIRKRFGRNRLTDITQQDVAQWLAQLRKEGLAPATVEKTRVTMNRSFQLGAAWHVAGAEPNPVKGVPRPKFNNAREMFVNSDQAAALLDAAAGSRNKQLRSIIALLLLTGMRVSELLTSRWEHLDVDGRKLFVPTSKNGRSRYVPLSQAALDVVTEMKRSEKTEFLFPNPRDPRKHLTTIKHGWQAVREAVGLPTLRIHDLRHSFASAAVSAGIDLYHVGKIMGHQNVSSTARYSHVANTALMAAVEAGAAKLNMSAQPLAVSSDADVAVQGDIKPSPTLPDF